MSRPPGEMIAAIILAELVRVAIEQTESSRDETAKKSCGG